MYNLRISLTAWARNTPRFRSYSSKSQPKLDAGTSRKDETDDKKEKNHKVEMKGHKYKDLAKEVLKSKKDEEKKILKGKRSLMVPQVARTDYIPQADIETEGLFAGYKPLFLGNSPLDSKSNDAILDGLFSSLKKLKNAQVNSDNNTVEIDVTEVLDELKKDNDELQKLHDKTPKIPWDASISGLVYNDEPFKGVPRSVVSKLKPFKLVKVEKMPKKHATKSEKIKLEFHNPKIKDDTTFVDLIQEVATNHKKGNTHGTTATEVVLNSRHKYETQKMDYAYKFQFVESDQRAFKNEVAKFTRLFSKEFMRRSNIRLMSDFKENYLPLYIYMDRSLQSRKRFQAFLYKRIWDYVDPLLNTMLPTFRTKEQSKKFENRIKLRIQSSVRDISEMIPSVYFTSATVDCLLHPSPVPGFGRIHWLNKRRRQNIFYGKQIGFDSYSAVNLRDRFNKVGKTYINYPVSLHWKTFNTAFSEWEHTFL